MSCRALPLVALAVAVSAMSAVGCAWIVQSDDLIGGAAPASRGDAGASSTDGAASGGGCVAGATVCDDFEGASTVAWNTYATAGATVVVDAVKPYASSRSLHASRAAASGRDLAIYRLALSSKLTFCEFDVFASSTSTDTISVFALTFDRPDPPATGWQLSLGIGGGIAHNVPQTSGSPLYTDAHVDDFRFDRWVHVRVDFDWKQWVVNLIANGHTYPSFSLVKVSGGSPVIEFGGAYQTTAGPGWNVFVDNVACGTE